MPELPEVEAARVVAERVAKGRRITRVVCAPDPIVFQVAPARFRRALLGRRVTGVGRHGKHLWFELDQRPWPTMHFGMTGGFLTPAGAAVRLVSEGRRLRAPGWPPRFVKLHLWLDDGGELAMTDARRLGRIRLRQDPPGEPPISALGFDALHELPSPARFARLLGERGAPMKALLLDQTFAAGVGNWIADEVLYQARVAPARRASTLSREEAGRVRTALRRVIETAVAAGSDADRFPRGWLFHRRWGRRSDAITIKGDAIRHDTIGGRTTAWVPKVQR